VPLFGVIVMAIGLYQYVVLFYILFDFLIRFRIINMNNQFVQVVYEILCKLVEPALIRIRSFLPNFAGLDFSPVVLLLATYFVCGVLGMLLVKLAA